MTVYPGQQFDELAKQLVFPSGYQNPTTKSHYHLVVVGAGPAGLIASISAAGLGARVALIAVSYTHLTQPTKRII